MNHLSPLWQPSAERVANTQLTAFMTAAGSRWGYGFDDYISLHSWSINHSEEFWTSVWEFCGVIGERGETIVLNRDSLPGAKWFPEARFNFARNLLRRRGNSDAIVYWGEYIKRARLSHDELYSQVAQLAKALREIGIKSGDRVATFMPNMPQTIVAMLATSSIGAIFTSASPDFGVQGLLDRFGQVEPKVLIAVDGYLYNDKTIDCMEKIRLAVDRMPSLERVIVVPNIYETHDIFDIANSVRIDDLVAHYAHVEEIDFELLPFNHPLYIMYSSGTTGVPKCIVHSAGGVLLQHLKEHQLHGDVKFGDRLFYFTTCGWMMWNWLASGLASGATLLLYDGSPFVNSGNILFDYADDEEMTHFGTSAKFIDAMGKADLAPGRTHQLTALRTMFSTGSPLGPEGFDYVYRAVKSDIQLASISGGTDIVSCFVLGNPNGPVWRGEIQCAGLGMSTEVFDEFGRSVRGKKGELVCTRSFPAMPIGFWDDPDGKKYRGAYFERFDNVWCHGDFSERTDHDGFIIHGRSDATLNPGGVRIGTAEIYRQVEKIEEVMEALVVGQEWQGDVRIVLFVKLREGVVIDDALIAQIKDTIRNGTTLRHVPAKILQVADIPRTKSGKIVELAVRNVVHGEPVKNLEALANPEALDYFRDHPALAS